MGKDAASVDFFVDILNAGPFTYSSDKVSGRLKNFGTIVQEIDTTKTTVLPKYTVAAPATTNIKLTKKFLKLFNHNFKFKFPLQKV